MTAIRKLAFAALLAGLWFSSVPARAIQPGDTVTGYHRFLSMAGTSEDEHTAFQKARSEAYFQCYRAGLKPKRESSLELIFPWLTGVGHSSCEVSDIRYDVPRHYECFAWYKATCETPVPGEAESLADDASERSSEGGGGEGGAGAGPGNNGAEGAAAY